MSTPSQASGRNEYEEGFFDQNTWIRPLVIFNGVCLGLIAVMVFLEDTMGWLGGRFGQVIFGMIASLIFMSLVIATLLLIVNGARYWSHKL